MEQQFKREVNALNEIFDFIQGYVQFYQLPSSLDFTIKFIVEELFTNMVKYNRDTTQDILLRLEKIDKQCVITMIDHSSTPFDIRNAPEVDVTKPAEARMIGGLGIHLVKKMVDKIDYQYVHTESRITLIKNLE